MTNTKRWYHNLNVKYNPYWFMHELREIRRVLHRKYRHHNKIIMRKYIPMSGCMDIEIEPKTRGWITF